ncbi:MAG: hypothetical protein HKO62_13105, partial [Gammaproteobacteria bacterium]|nr:hypothetical protein [Gammaproteobacteria bacterium]
YRPGYDLDALMEETAAVVAYCGLGGPARRTPYYEAFERHAGVDLDDPDPAPLATAAAAIDTHIAGAGAPRALLQDLVFSHRVAPRLGRSGPELLFDYPPEQAALAVLGSGTQPRARRFELFVDGIELANGFEELRDAGEQRRRFETDNAMRRELGQPERAPDERLLAALAHGLPPASGVALGVDRLLMALTGLADIAQTQAFGLESL